MNATIENQRTVVVKSTVRRTLSSENEFRHHALLCGLTCRLETVADGDFDHMTLTAWGDPEGCAKLERLHGRRY